MTTHFASMRLAALCLLAVATPASAGSAWVLWSQEVATEPGLVTEDKKAWRRMAAFDGKAACFSDASTRAEDLAGILCSSDGIDDELEAHETPEFKWRKGAD